jgi:hypothetical protein
MKLRFEVSEVLPIVDDYLRDSQFILKLLKNNVVVNFLNYAESFTTVASIPVNLFWYMTNFKSYCQK